jgi:hypothetical protein
MAVLHRNDGIQFVLRPYRELLGFKKASLFKKELELLAQNHGQYVRLFAQAGGGQEAVFSREPGYLLGESVWRYLDRPANLIYCEAVPDRQEAIVVIVREGAIYLDAHLPFAELEEELTSLVTTGERFEIYVYGNIPLTQTQEEAGVFFTAQSIASFSRLQASLFAALPIDVEVQLLPYQRVVEELNPSRPYMAWVVGGLLVLAGIGWYMHSSNVKEETQQVALDPLEQYRNTFSGPTPASQMSGLAQQMELLYGLPGWVPGSITYAQSGAAVTVNSLGGTTGMLLAWAKQNDVRVSLGSQGAALTMTAPVNQVWTKVPELDSLQLVLSAIIDKMMAILPGKSVSIGTISSNGGYQKAGITVQVNNIAPYVLSLIGMALDELPIVLTNCALTFKDGLLSGTIEFSALGS